MAVSKTRPAQSIREAYAAGISNIGENYLQEAVEKIEQLQELPLTWHFIGPIQSNKTGTISEHFHWVHSIDRLKIAQRLNKQRPASLAPLNVCIQVNIDDEASKSGITLEALPGLAQEITSLPRLRLRGLMAIPQAHNYIEEQRASFARLKKAFISLQQQYPQLDTLSMGMSKDMEAAIAEGTTILRIGTDIFWCPQPGLTRYTDPTL